jgi:hypothetical protein
MSFTLTQLQALEAAIASGHKSVSYDGKTVTYHSMAELIQAAAYVRGALVDSGALTPTSGGRGSATLAEVYGE